MAEKRNNTGVNETADSSSTQSEIVAPAISITPPAPDMRSQSLKGLQGIFFGAITSVPGLSKGLVNLGRLPEFVPQHGPAVPGTEFTHCVMGLARDGKSLLVVGENAEVQYIPFGKFVAIVENVFDRDKSSVIIQNFQEADFKKGERPQIIARINAEYSALIVAVGPAGRVIRKLTDINQTFYYYIPREELTTYYLVSKFQATNGSRLDNLLNYNDACRLIDLPLNPLMPRNSSDYVGSNA